MGSTTFYLFLALYAASTLNVNSKHFQTFDDIEKNNAVYKKYVEMDKNLKEFVNSGLKTALPYIMEGSEHVNVSSTCSRDIFKLISDIRKLKLSAFKLLDAISKVPEGILTGNIFVYGDYDECMATTATRNDGSVTFRGEYCMVHLKPMLPRPPEPMIAHDGLKGLIEATKNSSELMQYVASIIHNAYRYDFKFGICVPSGCSSEDINSIVKYIGEKIMIKAAVGYCDQQQDIPISTGKVVAIFFFSLFGLLSIIGTSMDYYARKKVVTFKSQIAKLLLCFSILTNFPKIISAKITEKSLSSLFGIRALSLFFIILLHHYFFDEKYNVQAHMLHYEEEIPGFFFQIILNGLLTSEVYFFVGGVVHSYACMKFMEKCKRKISYVTIILHRLFRLYPPYLFCMMSIYFFTPARGPFSTSVRQTYWENCDKNWWHNLLFINNFFVQQETCLFHSWYIAADMQLFLISTFTVPLFAKNPKKGISLHLGILAAGLFGTALWAWHKNILPSLMISRSPDEIDRMWNAYATTLPHIAPYFTGLLIGYFLSAYKDFKIPLVYRLIGWPVAAVAFTSMLFMSQRWNSGVEPTVLESILYFSFSKLIYVLAVSWMVICCARGYGGILNYILSLKVWIPISRISYMMFLMSPIIQVVYVSNLRMTMDSDNINLIWRYFGDLGVSFFVALAMATIIESPFIALEKITFRRKTAEETRDLVNNKEAQLNSKNDERRQMPMELENNIKNTLSDV